MGGLCDKDMRMFEKSPTKETHTYVKSPTHETSCGVWLIETWRDSFFWQCVAVCCSVLQCVAMCCSMLQCVAVCCTRDPMWGVTNWNVAWLIHTCITATRCNTLQHTATHCNTMQHTATHRQHTATHCNTIQDTATQCNILQHTATRSYTRRALVCDAHEYI